MSSSAGKKIIRVNTDIAPQKQKHMFFDDGDSGSDDSFSAAASTDDDDVFQASLDLRGMRVGGAGEEGVQMAAPPAEPAPAPMPVPVPVPAAPTPPAAAAPGGPPGQQQQQKPFRRDFPGLDWLENHDILYNVLKYYLLSSQSRDSDKRVNIVDAIMALNASLNKFSEEFMRMADSPASLTPDQGAPAPAQQS